MRWPYDKRVDPIHAWGAIAAGIAIAGAIYAARALNPHTAKSYLWPTNWMIIPVIVTGVGLILLFLPVRRSRREAVPGGVRGARPELPPNHVVRPELLGRLRAALLDGTGGGPRRVGVWGMGGSGKSVLAAALLQDPAVRRRFPDGLAWVRLEPPEGDPAARPGMLAQRQQELVAKLTPAGQVAGEVTDVEQGRDRLAELLRGRACLVVVDNVWTADDVYAFSVLDRRGALLVTTRDAGLVRAAGAAEVEVAELSDAQARTLAAGWAGVPEQLLPPSAAETLRLVGNLALGVATVAALARGDEQRWAELADRLRRAELAALELQFPGYPHPSLLAALQLGLDYLDPSDRQRYRELAVFAGRGAVPRSAVEALWAPVGVSATDAGDLLARFGDRALLRRDPVTGRVELHDLQFDVARADLGDSLPAAHEQLLAGYAARCPRGWPSGPDDGYFYQHLAGHLAAAGRRDELTGLLTDVEWMRSRLRAGGVTGLLTDYTTVPDQPGLALVQATIRLSAHVLAVDPDQLPAQLAGRTIGRCEPELARLHAAARAWPHAAWLCPIRPTLAQPGEALRQTLTGHDRLGQRGGGQRGRADRGQRRRRRHGAGVGPGRDRRAAGAHRPRPARCYAVAVSADGRTAVSGGDDGTVRVWDLAGTAAPRVLTGHDRRVLRGGGQRGRADRGQRRRRRHGAGVGPGRDRRAAGAHRPRRPVSRRWRSARTGGPRSAAAATARCGCGTWPGPPRRGCSPATTAGVHAVAVSADGRTAVSGGGDDGTVRVWDLAGTAAPRVLTGHDGGVSGVAVSADGRTAVSGGGDGTVRVWDLAGTAAPRVLTGHAGPVSRGGGQRGRADRGQRRRRRHGAGVGPGRDRRAAGAHRPRRLGPRGGGQRGRADRGQRRRRRHGAGVGPGRDRRAAGAHRPRRPVSRRWRSARTGGPRSAAAATARCGCGTWPGPPRRGCSPATPARSTRWRSARTGGPRSAAATTARCGCGTWPGPPRRGCSPATPAGVRRWRSARTGGPRSAAAATARCGCGTWPGPPRRGAHRPRRRGLRGGGQRGRADRGQRRRRRHGAGVGPGRGRRAAGAHRPRRPGAGWRSARTGGPRSAAAATARCGCGTWPATGSRPAG